MSDIPQGGTGGWSVPNEQPMNGYMDGPTPPQNTGIVPKPIVMPQEQQLLQKRNQYIEQGLQGLKKEKPEWFIYNDRLGERPIDGWLRQLDVRKLDKLLNETVKPTQEIPIGKVM